MALSVRKMAALLGVSKSQVARDAAEGMPMDSVDGARAWRLKNRDVSRATYNLRMDAQQTIVAGNSKNDLEIFEGYEVTKQDSNEEYRQVRTSREQIRIERERLELEQLRGSLIPVDMVKQLAFTAARNYRDALSFIADRVIDRVLIAAAQGDRDEVLGLIQEEIDKTMSSVGTMDILGADNDGEEDEE